MDEMKTSFIDKERPLIEFEDEKSSKPTTAEKSTQSPPVGPIYIPNPRQWYQLWFVWAYLLLVILAFALYGLLIYRQYLEQDPREPFEMVRRRTMYDGLGSL